MKLHAPLLAMSILALAALTACHNYTNDYVNAKSVAPLKTPPGVSNPTFTEHNPIPKTSTTKAVTAPSLVPPGLTEDEAAAKIALAEEKKKAKTVKNTGASD